MKREVKAQTIVELLVALGIASLVIIAIVAAVITSVANVTFSRKQGEATRLAREVMEWLRQERDQDWNAFFVRSGQTWCLTTISWSKNRACGEADKITETDLSREVRLVTISETVVEATVVVFWFDSKGRHEARLSSRFTDWRML